MSVGGEFRGDRRREDAIARLADDGVQDGKVLDLFELHGAPLAVGEAEVLDLFLVESLTAMIVRDAVIQNATDHSPNVWPVRNVQCEPRTSS